jgi:DNA-binding LacI/PurR family transcriptional regulator
MLFVLMRERGIEQNVVTISCNNDFHWLNTIHPRPATIDLRQLEQAGLATARILQRIENPAGDPVVTLVMPKVVPGG